MLNFDDFENVQLFRDLNIPSHFAFSVTELGVPIRPEPQVQRPWRKPKTPRLQKFRENQRTVTKKVNFSSQNDFSQLPYFKPHTPSPNAVTHHEVFPGIHNREK